MYRASTSQKGFEVDFPKRHTAMLRVVQSFRIKKGLDVIPSSVTPCRVTLGKSSTPDVSSVKWESEEFLHLTGSSEDTMG